MNTPCSTAEDGALATAMGMEAWAALRGHMRERSYAAGETLVEQGEKFSETGLCLTASASSKIIRFYRVLT